MNDPHTPLKVLNTTSPKASKAMYDFCDELVGVVPGVEYVQRKKGKGFEVGCIAGWAAGRGYKHLVIVNKDQVSALHAAQVFAFIDRAPPQMRLQWSIYPMDQRRILGSHLLSLQTKHMYVSFIFPRCSFHNPNCCIGPCSRLHISQNSSSTTSPKPWPCHQEDVADILSTAPLR